MPVSSSIPLGTLAPAKIYEALAMPGPCVTLLLPPRHPGDGSGSSVVALRTALREAAEQFEQRRVPQSIRAELIGPLEGLATDPGLLAGSRSSRVILRCPDLLEQYQLATPVAASLTVAGSFAIRRFFSELSLPRQFFILSLAKDSVSLSRGSAMGVEAVELPAGVPATIEQALEFERPDHDLENRSAVSGSTGAMRAIRFGTGSGRETRQTHVADYYRMVDRGIQKLMHDPEIPLLLAGVDEDTVLYRSVSTCHNLAGQSIRGDGKRGPNGAQLIAEACSILQSDRVQRERKSFVEARERAVPSRFLTELDVILPAAFEGRINQLYVDENGERMDVFERLGYRSWGPEDLLNLAMVQTIRHRGKASVLPGLDGVLAAASLRF